jgi:hypothetical protein
MTSKFAVPSPNGAPAVGFQKIGRRGEHVRHAVPEIDVPVAIIVDAIFDVRGWQKLRRADLTRVGAYQITQEKLALSGAFCFMMATDSWADEGTEMAKKITKLRPWTKEDVRMMRALAREKVKTSVIARKLKRSVGATYQQASKHGVTLGTSQRKRKA